MKLLLLLTILLASSFSVESKTLAEAMVELRRVMGLQNWSGAWVLRNSDYEVCGFSNKLNADYPAAFEAIESDPLYQYLHTTMVSAGVPWEDFVEHELQPALGVHAIIASCTTASSGGVLALRNQLYGYFHRELVEATYAQLRIDSPEFNELHETIEANQAGIRAIRCSPEVQAIYHTMRDYNVDFEFVFDVIGIIFGWGYVTICLN